MESLMQLPRVAIKASVLGAAFAMAALAVGQSVPDQRKPDALELLRNVEATYAAMSTYSAKSKHFLKRERSRDPPKREAPRQRLGRGPLGRLGRIRISGRSGERGAFRADR